MNAPLFAHAAPSYWPVLLLAALISAAVSIVGYWQNARSKRLDRHRQLFAEAFRSVVEYREFAYKVRRRPPGTDRSQITDALSDVQARLNLHMATLDIEAPHVAPVYRALVEQTRQDAGPQIAAGWDSQPTQSDTDLHIGDIDLSGLESFDEAFILAARSRLRMKWRRSRLYKIQSLVNDQNESSFDTGPSAVDAEGQHSGDSAPCDKANDENLGDSMLESTDRIPSWKRILFVLVVITLMTYCGYMVIAVSIDFVNNTDEYIAAFFVIAFWVSVVSTIRAILKSAERSYEMLSRLSERLFRSW